MTRVTLLLGSVLALMVVVIQSASVPVAFQEIGKQIRATCTAETGTTNDMIVKASNGNFVEDTKLKCYFKCIFEQFKLIDGDDINFDAMLLLVPQEIKEAGTKMIENCRDTTGKDLCDKSYNINICFHKEAPKEYFVI